MIASAEELLASQTEWYAAISDARKGRHSGGLGLASLPERVASTRMQTQGVGQYRMVEVDCTTRRTRPADGSVCSVHISRSHEPSPAPNELSLRKKEALRSACGLSLWMASLRFICRATEARYRCVRQTFKPLDLGRHCSSKECE